ncbi:MAG: DUF4369 domain-containing protein [Bacteroidales bacterium]|nr:DUF4369 domain-containing protein [Bacteroidales bacterium]
MKKLHFGIITIIAVLMTASCRNDLGADFTVIGELDNVDDGYQMLLFKSNLDGSTSTIAIDTLVNGRFEFTASAETGVLYHIVSPQYEKFSSMSLDFYVEPGAEIRITGKDNLIKNWTVKSRVRNQKIYQSYFDQVADIYIELQLVEFEYRKTRDLDAFLTESRALNSKVDSVSIKWLKSQRKITEPWIDLMVRSSHVAKMFKDEKTLIELRGIWDGVDQIYKDNPKGKTITMALQPQRGPLKVGDMFPYDTEVCDIHGYCRSLSEFKDKNLLLYFNSYGCKPCVEAKKELTELSESMKGMIEIIGLNVDAHKVWEARGKENPVPWYDFNEGKESYGLNCRFETTGIPTFVIVSKEGKILDIWAGYRDGIIRERIDAIL